MRTHLITPARPNHLHDVRAKILPCECHMIHAERPSGAGVSKTHVSIWMYAAYSGVAARSRGRHKSARTETYQLADAERTKKI